MISSIRFAILVPSLLGLAGTPLLNAETKVPSDGSYLTINAEKLEEPYQKDSHYAYTKSTSFSRVVYSSWTSPNYGKDGLSIANHSDSKKRAVLISELTIPTATLKADRNYQLSIQQDAQCQSETDNEACIVKLLLRCYGQTEKTDWGVTYEKAHSQALTNKNILQQVQTFSQSKCRNGLFVSLETSIKPVEARYSLKSIKLAIKEI